MKNEVLGNNWLSNAIPLDVKEKYPDLERLLKECAQPKVLPNRISAAHQLIKLIEDILAYLIVRQGFSYKNTVE